MIAALWLAVHAAWAAPCDTVAPAVARREAVLAFVSPAGTPRGGVTVRAVRHPGLPSETALGVGITDTQGRVAFTPAEGGPYRVVLDGFGACTLRVGYPAPPLRSALPWLAVVGAGAGLLAARRRR